MVYAVISDVHANEQALQRVLADAASQGAEKVVCLGDVVGYGPLPAQTLALVRQRCAVTLAGNHDDAVCGRLDPKDFIGLAADAVLRHREALSADALAWLRSLPYVYEGEHFIAVHGDFVEPEKFYYVQDERDVAANFEATDAPLLFVGHTHVPKLGLVGASGQVHILEPQDFTLEPGKRYVVNPGSVGYPRESGGQCLSSYVLFDSAAKTVVFRYLPFAVSSVLQRGHEPRRRRWPWLAAVGVAALALAAAFGLGFGRAKAPAAAPVEKPCFSRTERLPLSADDVAVVANLRLADGSCPVRLDIVFLSESGATNRTEAVLVKKANDRRRYKVPAGSSTAVFTIHCDTPGALPNIELFAPRKAIRP